MWTRARGCANEYLDEVTSKQHASSASKARKARKATEILEAQQRRLTWALGAEHRVLTILGSILMVGGLVLLLLSLLGMLRGRSGLALSDLDMRNTGLVVSQFGWVLTFLARSYMLASKTHDGRTQRYKSRLLWMSYAGLGVCMLSSVLALCGDFEPPPCSDAAVANATGTNATGSNATRGEGECADTDGAWWVIELVQLPFLLVAIGRVFYVWLHSRQYELLHINAQLWRCTSALLACALLACTTRAIADALYARSTGPRSKWWLEVILAFVCLLTNVAASPIVRHRVMRRIWTLSVGSQSGAAAALAMQMAGHFFNVESDVQSPKSPGRQSNRFSDRFSVRRKERATGTPGAEPSSPARSPARPSSAAKSPAGKSPGRDRLRRIKSMSSTTRSQTEMLLAKAKSSFTALLFSHLNQRSFTGGHAGLEAKAVKYSWRDNGVQRWTALNDWAAAFKRMNQRLPLLWIDMACLNQSTIQESLAMLPIYLIGTRRMLCLIGPSYTQRVWCCAEVFTCISIMGEQPTRLVVLPIDDPEVPKTPATRLREVRHQIATFDLRDATATNPTDIACIMGAAQEFVSGEIEVFNHMCKTMLTQRLLKNASAALLQNEREFAVESRNMRTKTMTRLSSELAGIDESGAADETLPESLRDAGRLDSMRSWVKQASKRNRGLIRARCILDPRQTEHSRWLGIWDSLTFLALIYTAVVTPAEVGFGTSDITASTPISERMNDPMWAINRVVDIVFAVDLVLQFRVAYSKGTINVVWVTDPSNIAKHYLRTWFPIDALSVLIAGFDYLYIPKLEVKQAEGETRDWAQQMKVLKTLRALRLMKLVRLLRGSRIMRRWGSQFAINHTIFMMFASFFAVIFLSHWIACIWGLQASTHVDTSWMVELGYCRVNEPDVDGDPKASVECANAIVLYAAAYYYAVNVITTVGSPPITVASPEAANSGEVMVEVVSSAVLTMFSSLMYALIVARLAGTFAYMNPQEQKARNVLADINSMAAQNRLPHGLRVQLRNHLELASHLRDIKAQHEAVLHLSPALQSEVCRCLYDKWLRRVWFLKDCSDAMRVHLALHTVPVIIELGEAFITGAEHMWVLLQGIAMLRGRMCFRGASFGDDFIIANPDLRRRDCVRIMTETANLLRISRKALYEIAEQFPDDLKVLRRRAAFLALSRIMVQHARTVRAAETMKRNANLRRDLHNDDRFGRALRAASAVRTREESEFHLGEQLKDLSDTLNRDGGIASRLLALERVAAQQTTMIETLVRSQGGAPATQDGEDGRPQAAMRRPSTTTTTISFAKSVFATLGARPPDTGDTSMGARGAGWRPAPMSIPEGDGEHEGDAERVTQL